MSAQSALTQALADQSAMNTLWDLVQASIPRSASAPCQNLGDAWLVSVLQQCSTLACQTTHQAALAALGFAAGCGNYGSSAENAQAAQAATLPVWNSTLGCAVGPCSDPSPCLFAEVAGDPWGTVTECFSGGNCWSCLDSALLQAVGAQVAAANSAVGQAQAAQAACARKPPSPRYIKPAWPGFEYGGQLLFAPSR